jgi:hypothetical protein
VLDGKEDQHSRFMTDGRRCTLVSHGRWGTPAFSSHSRSIGLSVKLVSALTDRRQQGGDFFSALGDQISRLCEIRFGPTKANLYRFERFRWIFRQW